MSIHTVTQLNGNAIVFCEGAFTNTYGKTAHGLVRRTRRYRVTAVDNPLEALELVRERVPLPAICGRICGHLCEEACNRINLDEAVQVRALKRFLTDYEMKLIEAEGSAGAEQPAQPVFVV